MTANPNIDPSEAEFARLRAENERLSRELAEARERQASNMRTLDRIRDALEDGTADDRTIVERAERVRRERDDLRAEVALIADVLGLYIDASPSEVLAAAKALRSQADHLIRSRERVAMHEPEGAEAHAALTTAALDTVRGVLEAAEWVADCACEGGACRRDLRERVDEWLDAGRPLASEGKEG